MIKFVFLIIPLIIFLSCCTNREQDYNEAFDVISYVDRDKLLTTCNELYISKSLSNGKVSSITFKNSKEKIILKDTVIYLQGFAFVVHKKKVEGEELTICTFKNKEHFFEITLKSLNDSLQYWKAIKFISLSESVYQKSNTPIRGKLYSTITDFLNDPLFFDFINALKNYGKGGGGYEISYNNCDYVINEYRYFYGDSSKTYMRQDPITLLSYGNCIYIDRYLYPIK